MDERDGAQGDDRTGDPLIGEDVGGYRIVERIGRGGMGEVYRAVQRSIGAQVAIKVLSNDRARDPEVAERFVAEARIPNLVRHDGLVNVMNLGVLGDGRPYQLMEYLVGASLADLFARHGALPVGTLCGWLREALRALTPLHDRGVVHRDLKPSNLFITTSGRLKVLDFGIAKLLEPDGRALTRTGQLLGTPEYMAPEQAEGAAVDHRADLFALGAVLFEGATGRQPFGGRLIEALAAREPPPSVGAIASISGEAAAALDAVIRTAMAPEPSRRFASAPAMEAALGALVETLAPGAFAAVDLGPRAPGPPRAATPAVPGPTSASAAAPAAMTPAPPRLTSTLQDRPVHDTAVEIPAQLGRYTVDRTLGRGGSGVVLLGFDPIVKRRVALKLLDAVGRGPRGGPERRERMIAEAQATARVNHPNVLALYELGTDRDRLFLALEYVEGSDLARWLAAGRRPWRAIVDMFAAAGQGLAAAHDAGVIHRDFKPSNVLVGDDGRPRVGDFGLADAGEGAIAGGTPAYMAPEQLAGAAVDARADQFAFAAALWEALHGELPYAGDSATAVALAARRGELRAPSRRVPEPITAALRRALSGSADDRFASMHELLAVLAPAPPRRRRRLAVAAGLAIAATAAVVVVAVAPRGGGRRPGPVRSLTEISALADPGEVLRALDALDDATLATPDARRLALAAAVRGPTTTVDEPAAITALAMADGRLVSASAAGFAIRELRTGRTERLPPIPTEVRALRVMADHLLALARDGIVRVPLDGGAPSPVVVCVTVSTGTVAATTTEDLQYVACPRGSELIDIVDLAGVTHLRFPLDQWVGFSSDGRRGLALRDGQLEIHDLATGGIIAARPAHDVRASAASGDLCAIATAAQVVIWNTASGAAAEVALARVEHVAIAGSSIIAASEHEVVVLDPSGAREQRWTVDPAIRALHVTRGEAGLRVVLEESTGLAVKDVSHDRELVLPGAVSAVALVPDGDVIAVANGSQLRLWHTELAVPWSSRVPVSVINSAVAFQTSYDGRWAVYGDGPSLHVIDLTTRATRVLATPHPSSLTFSPDDRRLVAVDDDGGVRMWMTDRLSPSAGGGDPAGSAGGAGVLPRGIDAPRELGRLDGHLGFLRVANDGALQIRLKDGPIATLDGTRPCGPDRALATSPHYALLRTGDLTSLCEIATGQRLPLAIPGSGRFAMDDHQLVANDGDRARLFEVPTGREIALPEAQVEIAWLDASRVIAKLADGTGALLPARGTAPIAIAGSHGSDVFQSFGDHVVGEVRHDLFVWDVREPSVRRFVGRIASSHAVRALWSDAARSLLTLTMPTMRLPPSELQLDVWPSEAASVAEIRRWSAVARGAATR